MGGTQTWAIRSVALLRRFGCGFNSDEPYAGADRRKTPAGAALQPSNDATGRK